MKMYKISDVAKMYNVSPQAVRKWIEKGIIKVVNIDGMAIRISEDELKKISKGE